MPPPQKKRKLGEDDLEPPPPNQLALANARAKSDVARSQVQAVVGINDGSPDPPGEKINMLEEPPMDVVVEVRIAFPSQPSWVLNAHTPRHGAPDLPPPASTGPPDPRSDQQEAPCVPDTT